MRQQSADQAQDLTTARTELTQLGETHHSLQQQLQVKVVHLQQTQDTLEDRARQHCHLQAHSDQQAGQLTQLRAELESNVQLGAEVQRQLADKTAALSGTL